MHPPEAKAGPDR